jgi:hypothetical protein
VMGIHNYKSVYGKASTDDYAVRLEFQMECSAAK